MIPTEIISAMRKAGALKANKFDAAGSLHFFIDFKVIEKEFPRFMDAMVRGSLGEIELELYDQDYIAYLVLPDGTLQWKPTRKLQQAIAEATML